MDIRRTTLVCATLVLTALLAACTTATQDQTPTERAVLADTEWVLIALNGNALIEGREITLNFEEASLDGSAGCNTYGGSYTASEDSFRLSGVYATEMACPEPEGIMDQEREYLNALNAAARFRIDGDRLEVYDEADAQILTFIASTSEALGAETPTASQPVAVAPTSTPVAVVVTAPPATQTSPPSPTPTTEVTPVKPSPAIEPPAGFKPYQDAVAGVSVYIPESWVVTGVVPGQYAILQSYPEDKYVGGEARQQGDTKCDLNIRPQGTRAAELIQQWKSNPDSTIVSEGEVVLQSGQLGTRIELESMGRSLSLISEINDRAVALTCFGEFEPFDAIAVTLGAADIVRDAPSAPIEPAPGFKQYQDSVAGVSVNFPESWFVTGVVPGQFAILQSYPEDKYVGGEARQQGDTKCDLTIHAPDISVADVAPKNRSDPPVTVVSEQEIVLQSGKPATRFEVDSMGRSLSLITEVSERVVVLTCFGELAPFDEIAITVGANE